MFKYLCLTKNKDNYGSNGEEGYFGEDKNKIRMQ